MANVLQLDCTSGAGIVERDFGSGLTNIWLEVDVAFNAAYLTATSASSSHGQLVGLIASGPGGMDVGHKGVTGTLEWQLNSQTPVAPTAITAMQFYRLKFHFVGGSPLNVQAWIDGTSVGTDTSYNTPNGRWLDLEETPTVSGGKVYFDNLIVGTTDGGSDIYSDTFEGDLSGWNSFVNDATIITNPGIAAPGGGGSPVEGRVLIAFNDGPLVASPAWTRIDGGDSPFPQNFVSGYDVSSGRQTLIAQTDTGTATVYINDHETALFDPRNVSSPYFGLLDGRQIRLQLYDPVAAAWEDQFRGLIDDITWDIDGSAVGADGEPINASIQIDCVDMFDYLAGYGLTPGLDGITPQTVPSGTAGGPVPVGMEDGVYYAETAGTVDDRFIEILTDASVDSTRYTIASGNIHALAVKYDPDESALQALRDAADAEFPFIANIYCDRHGDFQFRGRYSRFDPDAVAAELGSTWDFTRWAVGDGAAIIGDSNRAQLRTFSFGRARSELINAALCYPKDLAPAAMPGQVYADTTSITAYGKHSAAPMSDLLTGAYAGPGTITPATGTKQCALYAELLVKNQKDPRENVTTLGLKSMQPDGSTRATKTWALITKADIAHIVNVAVGYPAGTGLAGASPKDDYYIEGRHLRVRPANATCDYVELDLDVSPAVWSMDTHSVFPPLS